MTRSIRIRLSTMMFLQFFVWGAWFVTLGTYLGKGLGWDGTQIGIAYSTMPWGALIAPFFVGMIADRFFHSERVFSVCHLIGGGVLLTASLTTDPDLLFWILLLYALAYNPTLALANTVAFHQLSDTGKQFPSIRVWGTIGWIAAGLLVGTLSVEDTAIPMRIAAVASLLLATFALFLPSTPPQNRGQAVLFRDILGLDALILLKNKSFAVFVLCSLLISIPLAFYYNFTNLFLNEQGIANAAGKMTLGQMSEIIFMIVMPFFFVRLGVKRMLAIGMAAWTLRYLLFAFGNPESLVGMFYLGILLHGICYDFFFVTGQIYVDRAASPATRASAQGFITLITYGLGMLIGSWASGWIVKQHETVTLPGHDWFLIWIHPAVMAGLILFLFVIFFREQPDSTRK